MTGIGTVREDDPQLTVRAIETPRQPKRVLIDSRLDVPLTARILAGEPPLVICAHDDGEAAPRVDALRAIGAEVVALPNAQGKVDLPAVLRLLGSRGINELHVEAGYKLNGSLLREGCVDELLLYVAPSLLGNAAGMFDLPPPATLDERVQLSFHSVERVGTDLRIVARLSRGTPPPSSGGTHDGSDGSNQR
jgi:diaminohydroxyphosphoribosylaminopyrimidine deaminase/5-amino-6-(5-phosphoribosylamino)uracil reductase